MSTPKPHAVLVGMPGAGKTTIGQALAQVWDVPFVDSDELIAQDKGKACGEIFAEIGEPAFRELEHQTIAQALSQPGVLSLGGGAVLTAATRELLGDHAVVWLHVDLAEGVSRTQAQGGRPLLDVADPESKYQSLLEQREQYYEAVASHKIATSGLSPEEIVQAISQALGLD